MNISTTIMFFFVKRLVLRISCSTIQDLAVLYLRHIITEIIKLLGKQVQICAKDIQDLQLEVSKRSC